MSVFYLSCKIPPRLGNSRAMPSWITHRSLLRIYCTVQNPLYVYIVCDHTYVNLVSESHQNYSTGDSFDTFVVQSILTQELNFDLFGIWYMLHWTDWVLRKKLRTGVKDLWRVHITDYSDVPKLQQHWEYTVFMKTNWSQRAVINPYSFRFPFLWIDVIPYLAFSELFWSSFVECSLPSKNSTTEDFNSPRSFTGQYK